MGRKNIQQQRRSQIIKALNRCLLKKPYKDTTIKDIALEAGINHGMLHYYFKDKEEILLSFVDHVLERHKNEFLKWRASEDFGEGTVKENLRKVFRFLNEKITLNLNLSKVFVTLWELSLNNRKIKSKLKKVYQEWVDVAFEAVRLPEKDVISPDTVLSIVAYLEGISMFTAVMNLKKSDARQVLETFEEIIIRGLVENDMRVQGQ